MTEQQSKIDIIITTIKKGLGDKETKTTLKELGKGFKELTGFSLGWASVAGFASAAAVKLVQKLQEAERAAVEESKADAKLQAVMFSTGQAAGMEKDQLAALSQEISAAAGVDDELVTSAEAVLLTFTKVNSVVFPQTMKVAADMAAVLGGDLQGAVTIVGKAMNDFNGYTSLRKKGVSFTEEQIKQIENFKVNNDLMGYQKLILQELETEYGGAAKAINDAGDGSENLKISADNLNAAMGKEFMPIAKAWNQFWTEYNNNLADSINQSYDYKQTVKDLGITIVGAYGSGGNAYKKYFLDGHEISLAEVQDRVNQKRANDAWGASLTAQAKALGYLKDAAEQTNEDLEAMTKINEDSIAQIANFQKMYESYSKEMTDLTGQQKTVEEELALARKQGYSETSTKVQGYLGELDTIKGKIDEVKRQHEIETYTVILGYMQQKLAADGVLTDEETKWLIDKGVQWGVYSENALKAYEDASTAADDFLLHRTAAEQDKTVHVDYVVSTVVQNPGTGTSVDTADMASHNPHAAAMEKRAGGGPVSAGMVAMVGEKGPEPVLFGQDGYVLPTGTSMGNNVTINVSGAGDPRSVANEVMRQLSLQGFRR